MNQPLLLRPVAVNGALMGATICAPNLGRHVVLWGDNDSGKNRFTRCLELAITAGVDDIQGRGTASPKGEPVRAIADLAILANPNGTIRTSVTLSDEAGRSMESAWSMTAGGKAQWNLPDVLLVERQRGKEAPWWAYPVRTVFGWLTGGAESARRAMLPFIVPPSDFHAALNEEERSGDVILRASLRSRLLAALPGRPLETVDDVQDMLDQLRDEVNRAEEAEAVRTTVNGELRRSIDREETPPATLAALEAAARAAASAEEQRVKLSVCRPMLAELRQLTSAIQAEEVYLQQYREWLGAAPAEPQFQNPDAADPAARTRHEAYRALSECAQEVQVIAAKYGQSLQAAYSALGVSFCPCCGSKGGNAINITDAINWLSAASAPSPAAQAAYAQWSTAYAAWQSTMTAWSGHQSTIKSREAALAATKARRDFLSGTLSRTLGQSWDPSADLPPEDGMTTDTRARDELALARAANARWQQLREAERVAKEAGEALAARRQLVADTQGVIERLLTSSITSFEDAVSAYLPEGIRMEIRLEDSSEGVKRGGSPRRLFRPFIRRGGRSEAACGGAFTAMVLAITIVVLQRLPAQPTATFLAMPEDRGWSTQGLLRYLPALAKSPYPILISTNVEPPAELARLGWQLLPVSSVTSYGVYENAVPDGVAAQSTTTPAADATQEKKPRGRKPGTSTVRTKGQQAADADAAASAASAVPGGGFGSMIASAVSSMMADPVGAAQSAVAPQVISAADKLRDEQATASLTARGFSGTQVDMIKKNPSALARALADNSIRHLSVGGSWVVDPTGALHQIPPVENGAASS